jgi:hypothetical protein
MEPLSRQLTRWLTRQAEKQRTADAKAKARKDAQRQLLERQTRREKAGFYGRPLADFISPSRSRITKRKVQKGNLNGRIIKVISDDTGELQYHATKGWRSYSAA